MDSASQLRTAAWMSPIRVLDGSRNLGLPPVWPKLCWLGGRAWKKCDLWAWVIMANHVHVLLTPHVEMKKVTRAIKSYSARKANQILGRSGEPFWQEESYDHWIRSEEEMNHIIRYIEWNPVK